MEQSVLGNHYARNCPPRAPHFQPLSPQPPPSSDTALNPKTRTLDSYPPRWQEVITSAKLAFRAYVAGKCGFLDAMDGADEARKCLDKAVEAFLGKGGTLEPSMIFQYASLFY